MSFLGRFILMPIHSFHRSLNPSSRIYWSCILKSQSQQATEISVNEGLPVSRLADVLWRFQPLASTACLPANPAGHVNHMQAPSSEIENEHSASLNPRMDLGPESSFPILYLQQIPPAAAAADDPHQPPALSVTVVVLLTRQRKGFDEFPPHRTADGFSLLLEIAADANKLDDFCWGAEESHVCHPRPPSVPFFSLTTNTRRWVGYQFRMMIRVACGWQPDDWLWVMGVVVGEW